MVVIRPFYFTRPEFNGISFFLDGEFAANIAVDGGLVILK